MNEKSLEKLKTDLERYGIEITEGQINLFNRYGDFLKDYNEKVNLTSIVDDFGIVEKHFLDSAIICKYVDMESGKKLIDIGTGAGFPGIPLKIMHENLRVTLVDSIGKKVKFLELLVYELGLKCKTINKRAEDLGRELEYKQKYDIVTARAVKNLRELSEYCLPLVSLGGYFISLKGPDVGLELEQADRAIEILGGRLHSVQEYTLPTGDGRSLIIIKKISQTPSKYPRLSSKIAKAPLK